MAMQIQDAALAFNDNHSDRDGKPKGIILHHAAIDAAVEDIHRYHRDVNGWAGIGYHLYVRKDGSVWRGRPEAWLGAHTSGFNDYIGVCAEGNFEQEQMPAVQQEAIVQVIAYLKAKYGELAVTRHSDHDATACPGKNYPFAAIKIGKTPAQGYVLAFQRAALADGLSLPVYGDDGVWGDETASAANVYVYNGVTGERVRLAQELLIARGYSLGSTGADGVFGTKTEAAVKAFQSQSGLQEDGIIGVQTWKKLLGVKV